MRKDTHSNTWIVVANSARAVVLRTEPARKHRRWHVVSTLAHGESREHGIDLETDKAGEVMHFGTGRSALEHTPVKETEAKKFAGELSQMLEAAHNADSFDRVVLAASPLFLGYLRAALTPGVEPCVTGSMDKDYTHLPPAGIQEQLIGLV